MNDLQIYNFKDAAVRTLNRDGEAWFVAKDVADVLGYENSRTMTRRLDVEEKGVQILHTLGGDQKLTIINESGLYNAILGSSKPEAKEFRKWVTSEVLPAIRKDGGYIAARPDETPEELYLRAMTALKSTVDRQKKQLDEQKPIVKYYNQVMNQTALIPISVIATHLGVTAVQLNKFLEQEGFIYKNGKTWYPVNFLKICKYCDFETYYDPKTGKPEFRLKWTERGRYHIIERWNMRQREAGNISEIKKNIV